MLPKRGSSGNEIDVMGHWHVVAPVRTFTYDLGIEIGI